MKKKPPKKSPADTTVDDPLVGRNDLPDFGIHFHASHLRRLWESGKFPKPRHLTPRKLVWNRSVIKAWIAKKLADGEG